LTQFVSPDDEHDVLETCRVKNKNKYIEKNCASRRSFTKNHCMMHGQQNVKSLLHLNLRVLMYKTVSNFNTTSSHVGEELAGHRAQGVKLIHVWERLCVYGHGSS
jgi:hypothetical protein